MRGMDKDERVLALIRSWLCNKEDGVRISYDQYLHLGEDVFGITKSTQREIGTSEDEVRKITIGKARLQGCTAING